MPRSIGISPLTVTHPTGHAMTGCGPPAGFGLPSPWSRLVRRGFGSHKSDSGIFIPCASHVARSRFRYVFRLATPMHSLALASRRKIKQCSLPIAPASLRSLLGSTFLSCLTCLSPSSFRSVFTPTRVGSFQLSLALLVRYRSIDNI